MGLVSFTICLRRLMPEMTDNDRLLALYDQTADQSVKLARLTQRFEDCEKQFDQLFKRVLVVENDIKKLTETIEILIKAVNGIVELMEKSTQ